MMLKRNLLVIFWIAVVALLLFFSVLFTDTNKAIVAQVEPMKKAISYHKAVRVLEIYVIPGQNVAPGDLLLKVERPDLIMDLERKNNALNRLRIEKSITERKYSDKQKSLLYRRNQNLQQLKAEMDQLQVVVANNQNLTKQFGSLTGYKDTIQASGKSYYEIELEALEKEAAYISDQYEMERSSSGELYMEEMKSLEIREKELLEEIMVLEMEELELVKRSDIHGTIGSVSAQTGELFSPYSTILSIYEMNPSVIKAIMNEGYKYQAEVGQSVMVESTNRKYSIEGIIFEIGARIIEYPNRLKSNESIPMYGQELFIRIPDENEFLNGERVFVTIKPK